MTENLYVLVAPGATGVARAIGVVPIEASVVVEEGVAQSAADAGRTHVAVPVTSASVMLTFPQNPAWSEPLTAPLAVVTHPPGVMVKVFAGIVPLFLMLTVWV